MVNDIEQVTAEKSISGVAIKVLALVLALLFIFSATGRWLVVFTEPTRGFLLESRELSDTEQVRYLRSAVVRLSVYSASGSGSHDRQGSGFNIRPEGVIVTNRHLVEDAAYVRISFPEKGVYTTDDWIISEDSDLALLFIEGNDLPALSLSDKLPPIGSELLVIGNPLSYPRVANMAKLVGYHSNMFAGFDQMLIEASIHPGSSGSPIFNSAGEVVGVVYAVTTGKADQKTLGLAYSSQSLFYFIEKLGYANISDNKKPRR